MWKALIRKYAPSSYKVKMMISEFRKLGLGLSLFFGFLSLFIGQMLASLHSTLQKYASNSFHKICSRFVLQNMIPVGLTKSEPGVRSCVGEQGSMGVLWDWTSWPWSNVRLRGNNLMFLFTYLIDLIFRKLFICEIERLGLGPMSIWGETLQNFTSPPWIFVW